MLLISKPDPFSSVYKNNGAEILGRYVNNTKVTADDNVQEEERIGVFKALVAYIELIFFLYVLQNYRFVQLDIRRGTINDLIWV